MWHFYLRPSEFWIQKSCLGHREQSSVHVPPLPAVWTFQYKGTTVYQTGRWGVSHDPGISGLPLWWPLSGITHRAGQAPMRLALNIFEITPPGRSQVKESSCRWVLSSNRVKCLTEELKACSPEDHNMKTCLCFDDLLSQFFSPVDGEVFSGLVSDSLLGTVSPYCITNRFPYIQGTISLSPSSPRY